MKYIIANWKANKNLSQAKNWLNIFFKKLNSDPLLINNLHLNKIKIIICPPLPLIPIVNSYLKNNLPNLHVGAQDISIYEKGSYTGETTAYTLKELIKYVILGHSERRRYFKENSNILEKKVNLANKYNLKTIYCVRGENDLVLKNIDLLAYEPIDAIGTGKNKDVDNVLQIKQNLNIKPKTPFLYGGSVNENNIINYLETKEINGFLVGTASLSEESFFEIIKNCL